MKELLNMLPKEVLVTLLILMGSLVVWFVHRGLDQVRKLVKRRDDELEAQFDKLSNTLEKLNDKIDTIDEKLDLNSEGTKAGLYYSIDQLLTSAELFGVWSSQLYETYQKMYQSYLDLGDGLDKGKGFTNRAEKIEVNDTKFHEVVSTYNKNRRKLFLNHLEKAEEMF